MSAWGGSHKPIARERKQRVCQQWLAALSVAEVEERLHGSGHHGLYLHERLWLAEHHPLAPARSLVQGAIRQVEVEQRERERLIGEASARDLTAVRESLAEWAGETPGEVRFAARLASDMYLADRGTKSLRACVDVAAEVNEVPAAKVLSYLAGCGARVLSHDATPPDIWGWSVAPDSVTRPLGEEQHAIGLTPEEVLAMLPVEPEAAQALHQQMVDAIHKNIGSIRQFDLVLVMALLTTMQMRDRFVQTANDTAAIPLDKGDALWHWLEQCGTELGIWAEKQEYGKTPFSLFAVLAAALFQVVARRATEIAVAAENGAVPPAAP